jgi:hypothetical protein
MENIKIRFSLRTATENCSFTKLNEVSNIETLDHLREKFIYLEQKLMHNAVKYYLNQEVGRDIANKVNITFQRKREFTT